jgi:hypothetical protein
MSSFQSRFLTPLALIALLSSCTGGDDDDDDDNGGTEPAAPSNLGAEELGGGAHLTWTDNSDNEDEFMVMRMVDGGEYEDLGTVPFDTTQYHDTGVTSGLSYTYMVMAMNEFGASESNEVTFDAP